jgi:ABC-type multidrug transport system ATPase subunit
MTDYFELRIDVQNLSKRYGRAGRAVDALSDVSFAAAKGEIVGLLGVNGAGKSTLVRILSTVLRPDSGTARVAGFDVLREPDAARRSIGVAQQDVGLDESRTVGSLLGLHARLHGLSRRDRDRRIEALLAALQLEDAARRRIRALSGGMRRKVDLALALVHSPSVVFLDEPTVGLDPPSRIELWDQIRDLRAAGTTILLTTQHIEEADQLADRVVILADGRVVSEGTPAELKSTVSESTLELHFEDVAEATLGAACLGVSAHARAENRVRLPISGPDDVRVKLEALHAEAIEPVSARLSEASLEDLFLRLDTTARGPE